jgi:1,2-phenylacetyl-CoA epoxidase PaaB subunit
MAVMYARETHNRRAEGSEMWLVDRRHVLVADPESMAVNDHKSHRHNDGSVVAARRKENRKSEA